MRASFLRARTRAAAGPLAALGLVTLLLYVTGIGCPILYLSGVPCPGCGMSRALHALLRLDLAGALRFHPLVYALFPAGLFLALGKYPLLGTRRRQNALLCAMIFLFVAVYAIRLLMGDPLLVVNPSQGAVYRGYRYILSLFG